jgi:hypothetical protein
MFFGVKSSIEKIRLQDRIDYSESLRKIPKRSYVTLLSGDLLEWKKSINEHNIVWKRVGFRCRKTEKFLFYNSLSLI